MRTLCRLKRMRARVSVAMVTGVTCNPHSDTISLLPCLLKMSGDSRIPAILPISCSFTSISLDDDAPMCRICHNTAGVQEGHEPLHRVCWCKGTMGEVHKSCLERWLSAVYTDRCPVCHYQFQTSRVYKPVTQVRVIYLYVHVFIHSLTGKYWQWKLVVVDSF